MAYSAEENNDSTLNFKTLLEAHAYVSFLKSEKKVNQINAFLINGTSSLFEKLDFEVNWDHATLFLGRCTWQKHGVHKTEKPIFETWRYEATESDMEVTHERKGKTTAVFTLKWNTGNTVGLGLQSSITLLPEATNLFGEATVLDINDDSFKTSHDQEWTFSVKIPVAKNRPIKVDTVVTENMHKGTFSCQAVLRGRVSVQIFKKSNHSLLTTVTDSVVGIWNKMRCELQKVQKQSSGVDSIATLLKAFTNLPNDPRYLSWQVSGDYCCIIGTQGSVKVQRVS